MGLATAARRVLLEGLGWLLVVAGIAALVLPGPGLLLLFAGLAILAEQYEWAARRVEPVRAAALRGAADGVRTVPRILLSLTGIACLAAAGITWGISPDSPGWWPFRESWWLPGGWTAGATMLVSAVLALGLLVWSWRRLRDPDADLRRG
jgi:hypothetical protein